jgi:hypothetical protein
VCISLFHVIDTGVCVFITAGSAGSIIITAGSIIKLLGPFHSLSCMLLLMLLTRATRPNGEWGYSTRRNMLGHECPAAVSP